MDESRGDFVIIMGKLHDIEAVLGRIEPESPVTLIGAAMIDVKPPKQSTVDA